MSDRSQMKFTPDEPDKKPGDGDHVVDKLVAAHKAAGANTAESVGGRRQLDLAMAETPRVDRQGNPLN